jgi:nucleotide-binding universal stress UspA family protein
VKTLLVPLDGSEFAARALPTAVAVARAARGVLRLVRVVPDQPSQEPGHAFDLLDAEEALRQAAAPLRAMGLDVAVNVRTGHAADGIIAAAVELDADLVVMSTHGRGGIGRWYYGSVADEVLRRSPVPVLLVPAVGAVAPPTANGGRIVVPLDGSNFGEVALDPAVTLARALGADLVLLRVVEPLVVRSYDPVGGFLPIGDDYDVEDEVAQARAYLGPVTARLRASGLDVGERVEVGDAPTVIADVAAEVLGSVIVTATHGLSGLTRFALGSTATSTLQHTTVPVLLVRPEQLERPPAALGSRAPALSGSPSS